MPTQVTTCMYYPDEYISIVSPDLWLRNRFSRCFTRHQSRSWDGITPSDFLYELKLETSVQLVTNSRNDAFVEGRTNEYISLISGIPYRWYNTGNSSLWSSIFSVSMWSIESSFPVKYLCDSRHGWCPPFPCSTSVLELVYAYCIKWHHVARQVILKLAFRL